MKKKPTPYARSCAKALGRNGGLASAAKRAKKAAKMTKRQKASASVKRSQKRR